MVNNATRGSTHPKMRVIYQCPNKKKEPTAQIRINKRIKTTPFLSPHIHSVPLTLCYSFISQRFPEGCGCDLVLIRFCRSKFSPWALAASNLLKDSFPLQGEQRSEKNICWRTVLRSAFSRQSDTAVIVFNIQLYWMCSEKICQAEIILFRRQENTKSKLSPSSIKVCAKRCHLIHPIPMNYSVRWVWIIHKTRREPAARLYQLHCVVMPNKTVPCCGQTDDFTAQRGNQTDSDHFSHTSHHVDATQRSFSFQNRILLLSFWSLLGFLITLNSMNFNNCQVTKTFC